MFAQVYVYYSSHMYKYIYTFANILYNIYVYIIIIK